MSRHLRRLLVLAWVASLVWVVPVDASVRIENRMSQTTTVATAGLEIFRYGTGSSHDADFSAGTHTLTVESDGALQLGAVISGPWWDLAWTHRQCFEVESSDAVAEYPLRFEVDTNGSGSDGDDIRVVVGTNGDLLDSYSEGPFPADDSVAWAKAEPLAAGLSTYCVYFGNAAVATVSNEIDIFTYTGGQTISYYTMLDTYDGEDLDVVSYSDNNIVSDGTTTETLSAGESHTFVGVDNDTVITATGPIEGSLNANGTETLLPESYADSEFIHPVARGINGAWLRSPNGSTTIEAIIDGVAVDDVEIDPLSGSVWFEADFDSGETLILRSIDDTNFLAMWTSTTNGDVGPAVPWFGDTIYGVESRWIWYGAIGAASIQIEASDGVSSTLAVSDTAPSSIGNSDYSEGDGAAVAATSDGPVISGYQYADGNGGEVTASLPKRLLAETWILPVEADYYTMACPTNPTTVTIGATTITCDSTNLDGPGFAYQGVGPHAKGTTIEADHPIYVYYQASNNNDEHNLVGPRGARPYLSSLSDTADPVENLDGYCGQWQSAVLPSTSVFGTFSYQLNVPSDTTASFQMATDGSPFYGPDGTADTSFVDGDLIPYVADYASTVQLSIELCTDDPFLTPSVDQVSLGYDLEQLIPDVSNVAAASVDSPAAGTSEPLLRVHQERLGDWDATISYVSATNLGVTEVDLTTDRSGTQVSIIAGAPASPSPSFTHSSAVPYTVFADHQTLAGQTGALAIRLADQNQIETSLGIALSFVG